MDKANITEHLLRLTASQACATSIVGDLVEQRASAWVCARVVLRMLFAATWRSVAGAIAGIPLAFLMLTLIVSIWKRQLPSSGNPVVFPWHSVSVLLLLASISLWMISALSVFRFGTRHRQSIVAMTWSAAITCCACTVWLPHARIWMPLLLCALVAASIASPVTRKPSFYLLGTTVAFAALFASLNTLLTSIHLPSQLTMVLSASGISWLCSIKLASWILSRVQAKQVPQQSSGAAE